LLRFGALAAILLLAQAVAARWHPASGSPPREEIIYQSSELKIYRTLDRRGGPVVVLTNLDEEGNVFAGREGGGQPDVAEPHPAGATCPPAPLPVDGGASGPAREKTGGGRVRVVVNRGDGAESPNDGEVEVRSDTGGDTTVIINVNPPAPPDRETAPIPGAAFYPVLAYGGLAGPYRYPDHLHFLGYGHDNSAPSWFGGLGLNAGNGFGLKNGVPCGHGFDCMFGPAREHP